MFSQRPGQASFDLAAAITPRALRGEARYRHRLGEHFGVFVDGWAGAELGGGRWETDAGILAGLGGRF